MSDAHARFGKRPAIAPSALAEIARQAGVVAACEPPAAGPQWGAMHKLLLKSKVDPHSVMRLVGNRDVEGLGQLVRWLGGEEVADAPTAEPEVAPIDPEVLRSAMRAFRKRLRVVRLDAESRLGGGPLSGGKSSGIEAIEPPREYPMAVWAALERAGRLRSDGKGFFWLSVDDLGDD